MTGLFLALFVSLMAIDDDERKRLDRGRDAWWPDPDNKDKGLRENERPYIKGKNT